MRDANGTEGWRSDIDEIDAALLDGLQSGFPVRRRPFDAVAAAVDRVVTPDSNEASTPIDPAMIVERVRELDRRGLVRRLGPVLDPSAIGSSTLAALRVPEEALDPVAAVVNEYPQVTHNYRRDHEWNVWFVVTAESRARRDGILDEIAERTGHEPLNLPKRTEYRLDLQFPVIDDPGEERPSLAVALDADSTDPAGSDVSSRRSPDVEELTTLDRRLLETIQDGFPVTVEPYAAVAAELDVAPDAVVDAIGSLLAAGFIKRIGLVVDHRAVGFRHNRLVAWDVPSDEIDEAGRRAGELSHVTKCYHRPARPERDWPYTLFTMIHARDADRADEWIAELAAERLPYSYIRLDTVERFKQTGTRYETLLARDDE